MKYRSLVGSRLIIENDHAADLDFAPISSRVYPTAYLPAGTSLYGFVLPASWHGTVSQLFELYGLWENELGIGLVGRVKSVTRRLGVNFVYFSTPIFVGDLVEGRYVHSCVAEYDRKLRLWAGILTTEATPPVQRFTSTQNAFSSAQIRYDRAVVDFMTQALVAFNIINPFTLGALTPSITAMTAALAAASSHLASEEVLEV